MARILFSIFSNIIWDKDNPYSIDGFFEGLLEELLNNGNEVLFIRSNEISDSFNNKTIDNSIDIDRLNSTIAEFNPDLIIASNNSIPQIVLDKTTCEIILWGADSPSYYSNGQYIKDNIDRYVFTHHGWNNAYMDVCKKKYRIADEKNISIGYATAVQAREEEIKNNIVFLGIIGWTELAKKYFMDIKDQNSFLKALDEFEGLAFDKDKQDYRFFHVITSNRRIRTLEGIHDLGLKVYGYINNFVHVLPYSFELFKCFDYTPIYKNKDVEYIFNSSLISPTLDSAQAITGLSWRVADVMASNACLISPPKPDLDIISPYVKVPTYNSPSEARDLCQKLLKDEEWRKDIVLGCQKSIDENHRFPKMLKKIQESIKAKIFACGNRGKVTFICSMDIRKSRYKDELGLIEKLKNKFSYKIWKHLDKRLRKKGIIN